MLTLTSRVPIKESDSLDSLIQKNNYNLEKVKVVDWLLNYQQALDIVYKAIYSKAVYSKHTELDTESLALLLEFPLVYFHTLYESVFHAKPDLTPSNVASYIPEKDMLRYENTRLHKKLSLITRILRFLRIYGKDTISIKDAMVKRVSYCKSLNNCFRQILLSDKLNHEVDEFFQKGTEYLLFYTLHRLYQDLNVTDDTYNDVIRYSNT